jgi:multimeric flavodoxin WrbA
MTKVMIVAGSPRENGNSDAIANVAKEELEAKGAEVDIFQIRDKEINTCTGCNTCKKTGKCVFNDDETEFIANIDQYDNLLFVAPVYFAGLPGTVKSFIDRTYEIFDPAKLGNPTSKKVGVALTNGTMPAEQIAPIAGTAAFCLGVLGFFDNKNVICGGNLAPDGFSSNDDQVKQVKDLADWLSE